MNFCVVEFTGSKDMLVLHSSWIIGNDKAYCPPYWGNVTKLRKAISKAEPPNKSTWTLYEIRVLQKAGKILLISN